jgi:hypothetical protein
MVLYVYNKKLGGIIMSRQLVENITTQTKTLLFNLKITLHTCQMDELLFKVPIWQRLYYNMHSLDQWFINPEDYSEPSFHESGLNSLDIPSEKILNRTDLETYFNQIETNIMQYLNQIDDSMLAEKPENCSFTRLELILGQYRHLMYQVGIINTATNLKIGKQPKIIGMMANFPDENHYYE